MTLDIDGIVPLDTTRLKRYLVVADSERQRLFTPPNVHLVDGQRFEGAAYSAAPPPEVTELELVFTNYGPATRPPSPDEGDGRPRAVLLLVGPAAATAAPAPAGPPEVLRGGPLPLERVTDQGVAETVRDIFLTVEGHTDSVGDEAANVTLSQRRAEAVRAVLVPQLPPRPVHRGREGRGGPGRARQGRSRERRPGGACEDRCVVVTVTR